MTLTHKLTPLSSEAEELKKRLKVAKVEYKVHKHESRTLSRSIPEDLVDKWDQMDREFSVDATGNVHSPYKLLAAKGEYLFLRLRGQSC